MNWYRGFYRLWLALSVLWVLLAGAVAVGVTSQQVAFEKRVTAELRAEGLPPCESGAPDCAPWERDWRGREPHVGQTVRGKADLHGPYSRTDLAGYWSAVFLVPALFYGLLRGATWVLRGFGSGA